MSMPKIPDITPKIDLSREDIINLLLASVALEEISMGHLLNAESEKLQKAVQSTACDPNQLQHLLQINESIERTVNGLNRMQMLLQTKLESILQFTSHGSCTHTATKTCTHTATKTCTHTATKTCTHTATKTCTHTATKTCTHTATKTCTHTATKTCTTSGSFTKTCMSADPKNMPPIPCLSSSGIPAYIISGYGTGVSKATAPASVQGIINLKLYAESGIKTKRNNALSFSADGSRSSGNPVRIILESATGQVLARLFPSRIPGFTKVLVTGEGTLSGSGFNYCGYHRKTYFSLVLNRTSSSWQACIRFTLPSGKPYDSGTIQMPLSAFALQGPTGSAT